MQQKLYLKACPRCKGDMQTNRDMYGEYNECLQCGHMADIEKADNLFSSITAIKPKKKVA